MSWIVMLMLVINAVVRALRATGQLTGEPNHDRRKVLGLLGSLPLGVLVGVDPLPSAGSRMNIVDRETPGARTPGVRLCNIRERVHQPFRDSLLRSSGFLVDAVLAAGPLFPEKP